MMLVKGILVVFTLSFVDAKIYVFNTVDGPSVELYDCILHDGLFYCRRPQEPVSLNRSDDVKQCHHNGSAHPFADLRRDNVSVSTVLHQWRSSIEKVEQYSRYRRSLEELDEYLCKCTEPQSFGKNCEYMLPMGTNFAQTVTSESSMKRYHTLYVQLYGDVICYETLECDSGLLCLDWRDICDGVQQCMEGLDEENCDKLEFNECEDDEYRCMNGMCIPEEYFLDGDFDCLDWSDEMQYFDDTNCPKEAVNIQCDDRICPPNQFSCGDGQCILDRFEFQKLLEIKSECRSRREQYFLCETHHVKDMWTLPNGRCYEGPVYYDGSNVTNDTADDRCEYILRCALSKGFEMRCPCGRNSSCDKFLNDTCSSGHIQYPKAGIMAPYILFFYYRTRSFLTYRPNFFWINGTIKCHGASYNIPPPARFNFISTLRDVEDTLCQWARNRSTLRDHSCDGYGYSHSLTFNGRSYSFSDVCNKSKKCLSSYRVRDGFINCADKLDEAESSSVSTIRSTMQHNRFRCSNDELTWLSVMALGNLENNCKNKFDELWLGVSSKLADVNCNRLWKDQCGILRQYIEESWATNDVSGITKQLRIPFRQYCDTFWNLASKEDENLVDCNEQWMCLKDQWRCGTGQCIDAGWVLDGDWDCFDASDEDDQSDELITDRNQQVVPESAYRNRTIKLNRPSPFSSFCNPKTEWPCLPKNFSGSLDSFRYHRPCISRNRLGDSRIDCYGAIDERNTISQCNQSTMLGYNFQCQSNHQCIPYWNHCLGDRCNTTSDDNFWCDLRRNVFDCEEFDDALCFNGTCVKKGRCNRISDCFYSEDEYMCEYKTITKLTGVLYRQDKEEAVKSAGQKLRLVGFPTDSNTTAPTTDSISAVSTTLAVTPSPNSIVARNAFWCNRGIGVNMSNDSIACFCPPQYYGDKCQYHTDRMTILIHLDLSRSIYTVKSDIRIVLKILILFLFNNEVITNHIFHVRPVAEIYTNLKKVVHFLYSRSSRLLQHKTQRYFNRSNITNDHPYSVRLEIYERKDTGEPVLHAVWQYSVYFDYLPVFRLSKVLRLTKPNIKSNPCSKNPCNKNQDCQQLQNNKLKYVCLCKTNFTGDNCLLEDPLCIKDYCGGGSLCKPNYRGLLLGNQLPYCLCLFDLYGDQCDITHDQCASNPCENAGSCYSTSKPNTFACICTEQYRGDKCQFRKPEIKLYINETQQHAAAVVQYFDIDFVSLDLILSHQQVYRTLPNSLEYRHGQETAPEIILVKLYSSDGEIPPELYVISVQMNVTTIYATTQLIENNRCVSVSSLISNNQSQVVPPISPIGYHSLCQKNESLFCFQDDFYLCICDENHSRVECFRYDSQLDRCSHCLAGGRCLKGDRFQRNDFICLCPSCHSGTHCQFDSNSFTFTLDQLFFVDLISQTHKTTLAFLILVPLLLFLLALPNNLFSIITFRRPRCLCNGVGQYLLYMSVINQINLALLAARLIHLATNITDLHSHHSVDAYLCKILSYLLTSSSRMVYWLSSLVAIERVYMTLFLNGRWLRKPHIARRLIVFTIISILISDIHELIFVNSLSGINEGKGGMCVIVFPIKSRSIWRPFHLIISIMNSLLPLLINMCCTMTISCVVARKKINTYKTATNGDDKTKIEQSFLNNFRTSFYLVYGVLSENKELVIGPSITLVPQLFSLPLIVISFTLYCQNLESSWVRYLLIVSYFISFIPQMTSFMLYVLPSSFYSSQWHGTKISRWAHDFFRINTPVPTITTESDTTK